jgi:hypothetical protein
MTRMNRAKRRWCEREADVVRSLRTGSLPVELREHVLSCVVCAEAQSAAEVMLQTASLLRVEDGVPAAGLVWSRAQVRKREMDLKRATRPLIVMRVLSVVYVVLCAGWAVHSFWRPVVMELASGLNGWLNAFRSGTVGLGAAIALLAIAIGAWYLLYDGRRSDTGIRST